MTAPSAWPLAESSTHGFVGRVAVVSGAASGIGRSVALALARAGACVVASDIDGRGVEDLARDIRSDGGQACGIKADVSQYDAVAATTERAVSEFGALHLAFNNAGIAGPGGPLADLRVDEYLRLIEVNLHSVFYAMHTQIPHMVAAGGGAIVNTSSVLGLVGRLGGTAYVTAKHAVTGMTKAAALDYAAAGVRVNTVHPGYIDTPLIDRASAERRTGLIAKHPIGRLGGADEVARVVLFLLSGEASFVTGAQYVVDGGYTVQ